MSDVSSFDPSLFLDATLDTPTERRNPLPVDEYVAVIGEISSRTWASKDGSKSGIALDVPLLIETPAALQSDLNLPANLTVRDSIMLDLTPAGGIDNSQGKNSRLRLYREACDMNKPGDVFAPRKMQGTAVKVRIRHEPYQDMIQEKVAAVSRS